MDNTAIKKLEAEPQRKLALDIMDYNDEELEVKKEIFRKYKYALIALGVDLKRADVSLAIDECYYDFEAILQAFILWGLYKQRINKPLESPSDGLIKAIKDEWKPFTDNPWSDKILSNPQFKSPGSKWWEAAEKSLGREFRNQKIVDVVENPEQESYIQFSNGLTLRLNEALDWDWEKIRDYALREGRYSRRYA